MNRTAPRLGSFAAALLFVLSACGGSSSMPPATAPTISSVTPASGPGLGGTSVNIVGVDFGTPVTVHFGGIAATVSAQTATSITATAPPHALGAVDVVVTNHDDQFGVSPPAFNVVYPGP